MTKLEGFLVDAKISRAKLAKEAGYTPQYMRRVRSGRSSPTNRCKEAILAAVRNLSRDPSVTLSDLFEDDSPTQR